MGVAIITAYAIHCARSITMSIRRYIKGQEGTEE